MRCLSVDELRPTSAWADRSQLQITGSGKRGDMVNGGLAHRIWFILGEKPGWISSQLSEEGLFSPNRSHQLENPLQALWSRLVSYKPRMCWSALDLGSFMILYERNTPLLIFLKVSCFSTLKYIDWAWQRWGSERANWGWFSVITANIIATLNSNIQANSWRVNYCVLYDVYQVMDHCFPS